MNGDQVFGLLMTVVICGTIVVLGISTALIRRRKADRGAAVAADPETRERLERMERAIDTIAVEVERVSEGQRFVSKVLAERKGGAAPAELPPRVNTPH
jgi:hypothetical protein